ncbi:class I adenylate-forming enzyme family protein [Trujillonella endophytica]|uniref:Acyl-CoA synthetase (AMP-forming)/AMP-acid ligase II n=1 Tax=Trujillonella endophytica TaxID=673521 RepID=A0A1H8VWB2_9ACTN|nr:class I adenylate-forming enzyme family protein [Trujillella endophytica]SEP19527.1 Acyl-CoA synthetase (AMP-forming)/AMP-acid ligase II [Trujillella endophytica]
MTAAEPAEDSLAALLLDHPAADDQPLLHTATRTLTAGEARATCRAWAAELRALGVVPGEAVAVRLDNAPECVLAMAAVWTAGAVFVPLNPASPATEIAHSLAATLPAAIIESGGADEAAVRIRALDGEPRRYEAGAAFITWTSGTTGPPKAILHTHGGYLELLDRVLGPLRAGGERTTARPPSPNLIPVSLALNSGIYNALFGLRAGAPLVIMDRFRPEVFAELVARFDVRSVVLPPAAIAMLNASDVASLVPLRYVRSITAPLSPTQARLFRERFGVFVLNSYGQAELGEVVGWTAADAREHPEKVGAAGRPLPGVGVRIVGPDGGELPAGRVGALRVRTARMASGYATGEQLSARIDADGYVETGDLARIDDDGFVWIEGRAGILINRGGNKVFPEQVEEVLELCAAVAEAAVVGAPDARLGEVPVAFVVDAPGLPPATDAELSALCREHLVAYKVPVAFHHVAALPRTDVGKLRRPDVAAMLPS